jgi:hypothetical protein
MGCSNGAPCCPRSCDPRTRWQGPIHLHRGLDGRVRAGVAGVVSRDLPGLASLYGWVDHPVPGKEFWFEPAFAFALTYDRLS